MTGQKQKKFLKEEGKAYKELEATGFTEEQMDALTHFVEFKIRWEREYNDIVIDDLKKELLSELKKHKHIDGEVFTPL